MMKKISMLLLLVLAGCATPIQITEGARKIQVMKQSNVMANSCAKLGPVTVTVDKVQPAQAVYDEAIWKARDTASAMGADSMVILNDDHLIRGLANIITIHATALKCY